MLIVQNSVWFLHVSVMQFIKGSSRQQSYFATLEEQVAADNSVRLDAQTSVRWSGLRRDVLGLRHSSYCGVVLQINAATPHTKAGLPQLAGQVVRHGYEA